MGQPVTSQDKGEAAGLFKEIAGKLVKIIENNK
jgi:hypothetical protein